MKPAVGQRWKDDRATYDIVGPGSRPGRFTCLELGADKPVDWLGTLIAEDTYLGPTPSPEATAPPAAPPRQIASGAPDRSGCLWFCGMEHEAIPFDDRYAGYRCPPGRNHDDQMRGIAYCTDACRSAKVPPMPPNPYGHTKHYETGPSAVAAAAGRQRDTLADLVDAWDLLPDVRP